MDTGMTEEVTVTNDEIEEAPAPSSHAIEEDPWVSVPLSTVQELTLSAKNTSPTPSNIGEALERIAQTAAHLRELGVPMGRIDEIAVELRTYVEAQECIVRARESQFCVDARAVLLDGDSDTRRAAAFLRQFAEHITAHALIIAKEVSGIEEIVDCIPSMEESEEISESEE